MTVAELEAVADRESAEVVEWRFSQLTLSGYAPEDAIALATRFDVDLHKAVDLVARGCAPRLALRILL
jgi:hypothetical protein